MRLFSFLCAVGTGLAVFGNQARCQAPVAWPAYPAYPSWPQAGIYGYAYPYPYPYSYPVQPMVPIYRMTWPGPPTPPQGHLMAHSWPGRGCAGCVPSYGRPPHPVPVLSEQPEAKVPEQSAPTVEQPLTMDQPLVMDACDQKPAAACKVPAPLTPQMIGDLGFGASIFVGGAPGVLAPSLRMPLVNRGAFKAAENESPRPVNRFFVTYNYYSNVFDQINGDFIGHDNHLHREVFGLEKTFLGGNASIGVRASFFQYIADAPAGLKDIGDTNVIFKYAFINNPQTGNVLSSGLVVTVPTGPSILLADGSELSNTLIQPWLGWIWNYGRFYTQGFTSVALPTDSNKDVTLLFNDFGVGYYLYQQSDGWITRVVPTAEVHVTTPLNHRGFDPSGLPTLDPVRAVDLVVLTGGTHVEMGRCLFTLAAAVPVTGPRPYTIEAIAQFNVRW